jgi:hypothetical protein
LGLDLKWAKKRAKEIIEKVQAVKGCLTINFHPHGIINKDWFELFLYIIDECAQKGAKSVSTEYIIKQYSLN